MTPFQCPQILGDSKELCVIFCRQRSGSTLLRSYINSHPDFIAFGEVFFPDADPAFLIGFYPFWLDLIEKDKSHIVLERDKTAVLRKYFKSLAGLVDFKKCLFIDVKYSHAESVVGFFDFVNQNKIPVVHLIRENVLATYISDLVGVARLKAGQAIHSFRRLPPMEIEVPVKGLIVELEQRRFEHIYYRDKVSSTKLIELKYEDIFIKSSETTVCPASEARRLCDFVLAKYGEMQSDLCQQGVEISAMVKNWDDVTSILSGTQFAQFCEPTCIQGRANLPAD